MSLTPRFVAASAGALVALALVAGPVQAQDSPPPLVMPEVLDAGVGPAASPDVEAPAVAGAPVEQVAGVTQARPLPRTGGDIGTELAAGLALIGAGGALAVAARRRRATATA